MRVSFPAVLAALVLVTEVSAIALSDRSHHARIARRSARKTKRCIQAATPQPSTGNNNNNNDNNNNNNNNNNNTPPPTTGASGTIQAFGGACGDPNASSVPTRDNGPNGAEWWLTCGIQGGGWTPPPITLSNMVYKSLEEALSMPGNPFGPCQDNVGNFNAISGETGIPAILLAAIAMQESSCRPYVTGPNGEIGLMQITPDKCQGDCFDPRTNIGIGGRYLKSRIDANGGNVAQAMGEYNGWFPTMTEFDANNKSTCGQRNNLDYLQNVFNGYCQGVDPSSLGMGTFNNLATC